MEDKVEELDQSVKDDEKNTMKIWVEHARPLGLHQNTKHES
jgi:hypothetical protein